jgi:hypothetical protein
MPARRLAAFLGKGRIYLKREDLTHTGAHKINNAIGQILLARTLLAGESTGVDGSPPLRVTVGNAAVTQVTFRGQPVELAASTRDNVARLELK